MRLTDRLVTLLALTAVCVLPCASQAADPPYAWEARLSADHIVLLGEVHDNGIQQRLRLEVLQRAVAKGWRPAIAMEQFDREHQQDIDQARKLRPLDADYLIEQSTDRATRSGWNWDYYRPYVALALEYHLPLLAANLSRGDAERIVSHGYGAVFDASTVQSLGLEHSGAQLSSSQEREVQEGHCHMLPRELLPAMARAQLARDAVMAAILRAHAEQGVVLLAGDGHARRDLGVPRWLASSLTARVFSVGFLEQGVDDPPASAFDAAVVTPAASRADPCASFHPPARRP